MAEMPKLSNPFGPGPGGAAAPAATAAATGSRVQPTQTPSVPQIAMDPVNQQAILAQIQRPGWTAAQPVPDVDYINDPVNGPTPVVKGYSMVITDPKTSTNEVVKLSYSAGGRTPWGIVEAPKSLPKDTASTSAVGSAETGWYLPNGPGGAYQMVVPPNTPNADDEILKAVKRQDAEAERNEKAANEAAGRGYQTNAEWQKMANDAAKAGLDQATLQENIRQFNATEGEKRRQFDIKQAAQDRTDAQQILQSQAQTGLIGAQTAQTQTTTDVTRQKLPGELAQQQATLASTQAGTAKTLQDIQAGKAPTTVQATLGTTTPSYAQVNPLTGQVTFAQNPNFQPKTQAEIAARVGQIQGLAQQKQAEVQAKVGKNGYTADNALAEFNSWWDQNVGPQQASLQAAQEDALLQRAKEQATMRGAAYQQALGAGNQAISGFNAMAGANPVGPGYAEAMEVARQGKIPTGEQMKNAFTYQAPNPADLARQGTLEALKYIDPTAAAATGAPAPNLQGMDIGGMLNRTSYMPGATRPPPPAPAPAPAPGGPPPPAPGALPPWATTPIITTPTGENPWSYPFPGRTANPFIGRPGANFNNPSLPWDQAPNYFPGG